MKTHNKKQKVRGYSSAFMAVLLVSTFSLSACETATNGQSHTRNSQPAIPLKVTDLPSANGNGAKMAELFGYVDSRSGTEDVYYNVFHLGPNRRIAIVLRGSEQRGNYTHDQLGLYDITHTVDIFGRRFDIGENAVWNPREGTGPFHVVFRPSGNDYLIHVSDRFGRTVDLSLNKLYLLRVQSAIRGGGQESLGNADFVVGYESTGTGNVVFYPASVRAAVDAGIANPSRLKPRYVVPISRKSGVTSGNLGSMIPIGDSGYALDMNSMRAVPLN